MLARACFAEIFGHQLVPPLSFDINFNQQSAPHTHLPCNCCCCGDSNTAWDVPGRDAAAAKPPAPAVAGPASPEAVAPKGEPTDVGRLGGGRPARLTAPCSSIMGD